MVIQGYKGYKGYKGCKEGLQASSPSLWLMAIGW
jgi:hypothetical protein